MSWIRIRKGKYLKTILTDDYRVTEFNEVDDLDTKTVSEARDNFERAFILVRDALSHAEQYCCDDEADRLSVAQIVVDTLRQGQLIRKVTK